MTRENAGGSQNGNVAGSMDDLYRFLQRSRTFRATMKPSASPLTLGP